METRDPLEEKVKSVLTGFKEEPPGQVWENLRMHLHPELQRQPFWRRIPFVRFFRNKPLGFHIAVGGITLGLAFSLVYINSRNYHAVRGHAYAGQVRLNDGTAGLFRVADQALPWDSVSHYRSSVVDTKGHFQFSRVRPGRYLLRVAPAQGSREAETFLPTWFSRYEGSDSCDVITISGADCSADIVLLKKQDVRP